MIQFAPTGVCAGREGLGGGYRHHQVLRPRQPRHPDGPDREGDPGQAGVAPDREVPAAGRDGGRTLVEASTEGTPQGGPLSPLLANIYLDALDKELQRRKHSFCRYADDCNIYVGSRVAAERTLASLQAWIEKHLRLQVNTHPGAGTSPGLAAAAEWKSAHWLQSHV